MTPGQHFDGGSVCAFWERLLCSNRCRFELTTLMGDIVEKERNGRGSDCSLNEGGREGVGCLYVSLGAFAATVSALLL